MLLGLVACGMAEDEQDDRNRSIYLTFDDERFMAVCLDRYDLNGDGRFSRYEAERIVEMDCSGQQIRFLDDIDEFAHLERLDCSDNELVRLNVEGCTELRTLNCSRNALTDLRLKNLRVLTELNCSENRLSQLELQTNGILRLLEAQGNSLVMLDVASCAGNLKANVRSNPLLETVYYRPGQQIDFESPTTLIERE